MEEELGTLPEALENVIKTGESKVAERLHTLKLADRFGWSSVQEFQEEDLARSPSEEKKLKKIRKKYEEQKIAKAGKLGFQYKKGAFKYPGGASGSGSGSGAGSREGERYGLRSKIKARANPDLISGRRGAGRRWSATTATGLGTSPATAPRPRRMVEEEEETEDVEEMDD